jgi:hypothetical protein
MTIIDIAIRKINILIDITSQTQLMKPTIVVQYKDQELDMEIVNNCITIQYNKECLEELDCGCLDQSKYVAQLILGGALNDKGEIILMKKLAAELTQRLTNKRASKTEQNKIILTISYIINS